MPEICDHTSVGMLVWKNDELLLIEKRKFPYAFAPPAGHVDVDIAWEDAAKRELLEEVGLHTKGIKLLLEKRMDNPCRREGGSWHIWKIYEIETSGEINRSLEETKQAGFYTKEKLQALAIRTERYLNKELSQKEWERAPGLEIVWYQLLTELSILSTSH